MPTWGSSALQFLLPAVQRCSFPLQLLLLLQQVSLSSSSCGLKQDQDTASLRPRCPLNLQLIQIQHCCLTCGLGSVDGCNTAGWYGELEVMALWVARPSWDGSKENMRMWWGWGWNVTWKIGGGSYCLEWVVLVHWFYAGAGHLGDWGVLKEQTIFMFWCRINPEILYSNITLFLCDFRRCFSPFLCLHLHQAAAEANISQSVLDSNPSSCTTNHQWPLLQTPSESLLQTPWLIWTLSPAGLRREFWLKVKV